MRESSEVPRHRKREVRRGGRVGEGSEDFPDSNFLPTANWVINLSLWRFICAYILVTWFSIMDFCNACLNNARKSTYFLFSEEQMKSFVIWMFILIFQITCTFNISSTTTIATTLKECILHRNPGKNPWLGYLYRERGNDTTQCLNP